jgi:hypothetical protein
MDENVTDKIKASKTGRLLSFILFQCILQLDVVFFSHGANAIFYEILLTFVFWRVQLSLRLYYLKKSPLVFNPFLMTKLMRHLTHFSKYSG